MSINYLGPNINQWKWKRASKHIFTFQEKKYTGLTKSESIWSLQIYCIFTIHLYVIAMEADIDLVLSDT